MVERFAILLVALDPTRGSELQKTRPCVVVSPSEINVRLRTIVIAPITSNVKNYPTRITIDQENVRGSIALDQIRAIDKIRIVAKIGSLDERLAMIVTDRLVEFFHY
ncbi:MAG: type II toxin-antitoxin system PemK/MazF family toxin [Microcystis viridis Mv_BB_P_19951000_S69]|jgi:mRNA interferase MazF|uniref:Type II toxin-antitoxin system PemK/MazF family toxin n=1 Tax=Microcystis viridis Mv_BB_P_19951000_S68D TaxID=2486270 RepID=A0A552H7N6_MICVR|nr:type II toxin-antitoxin system PemK/MazF family toxin [Microcystis aeruginosa]TRU67139.1 MAG: type II toxin-antitoxin system PemK/MazF family toxin [Microcystis viridis Mv_BB_P_19951000_S68D]TRU69080.1 MAG: type II toxin-antitoxin system PemK/MazF family toxin [Microcystis viridis Mv_BB_P_19951000_S69]TRU77495.1 MAG: type II toxin-antitoxin system PemK/MazF family toxin [Microcystis viridis Mv_BB_P_19951000_S68]TRU89857.1 MAG: type II toxin-antitoxin system PemK/MazF family toxin [Microcysti